MGTQEDIYYQAYLARDHRFDGKFFIGVKTTGIYCRPICPSNPMRKNVEFFNDALSAEKAGYRPCLRCRPESAPSSPAWMGRSATVQRALKLISANGLLEKDEDAFAALLGMSARHLRRLFEEELGKTPKQISDAGRLGFSRKLIVETRLPITEIAFTSGFSSIRRFNEAFKDRFHRAPSELRRGSEVPGDRAIQLSLSYRPPLDWSSLLRFYQGHAISGIESVDHNHYRRVFDMDGAVGALELTQNPKTHALILRITTPEVRSLYRVVQNIRHMFDLDSDPALISAAFSKDAFMSGLGEKHPGLRLPRGWDPYETAVCTILGQLVSTEQAARLVKQLVENYGPKVTNPVTGEPAFLFPSVHTLARETLAKVGTTQARKNTIQELSRRILSKDLRLDSTQDPQSFRKALLELKGIGPWSAEYISLRALGDTDAFPGSDLILKRVTDQNPGLRIEAFRPWQAYAAIYLWKEFAATFSKKKEKKS